MKAALYQLSYGNLPSEEGAPGGTRTRDLRVSALYH